MQMTFTSTTAGACGPYITDISVIPPLAPTITTNPSLTVYQTTPAGTPVPFTVPTTNDPNTNSSIPVGCTPGIELRLPGGTTAMTLHGP